MNLFQRLFNRNRITDAEFQECVQQELQKIDIEEPIKKDYDMKPIVDTLDKAINDLNKLSANNEANVRKSQEKRVLAYLKDGYTITQLEALQMFGCMRLSDRIFTLRNKGYNIKTKMIVTNTGKKIGQYKLV